MNRFQIRIPIKVRNVDTDESVDERIDVNIDGENYIQVTGKFGVALQRLVDSIPAREPSQCGSGLCCAGCGIPGVGPGISEIPSGQAALHWVVRGAYVCIDCFKKAGGARPLDVKNPGSGLWPSRDEFIRALGNVLEAYDGVGGDTIAVKELHRQHVVEARKLIALVLPQTSLQYPIRPQRSTNTLSGHKEG